MKYLTKNNFFANPCAGLIPILALFSAQALSASSYLDPGRIIFVRPSALEQRELIDCFTNGNCKQEDKIRIYPMPCSGSAGKDCTGCYVIRNNAPIRIDDLNSAGTCSGAGTASEQKIRVFVGYERKCPSGTPVGDTCIGTGQLLLSCNITSEGQAGQADNPLTYSKDCFGGQAFVRQAKKSIATVAVTLTPTIAPTDLAECPAGTTGVYPACVACSDTTYKSTSGSNACTTCTAPPIANSLGVIYSTAGTTKSSTNDCKISDFTCKSGFTKNLAKATCDDNSACLMDFEITRTRSASSTTASDGGISMLATTPSAGPVIFNMVPNLGTRSEDSNTSGSLKMYWAHASGIPPGSYSISAGDLSNPSCILTKTVNIGSAPAPSPTPSPSPCTLAIEVLQNISPTTANASDGSIGVRTTNMVGTVTFSISPNVGLKSNGANGQFFVTQLSAGYYVITASDAGVSSCSRSQGVAIAPPPAPSPSPSLSPAPSPSPTIPPCEVVREMSSTRAGDSTTGSSTKVVRFPPNIQVDDRYLFMIFDNWIWITAIAGDSPNSLATRLANEINSRTPQQWEDYGKFSRTPPTGTPYFPPTATVSGADISVVTNFKTLFYHDDRVFRTGCYGQ